MPPADARPRRRPPRRGLGGPPGEGSGARRVTGFAERLAEALYRLDRREYGEDLSGDAFLYTRAAVAAAGRREYEAVLADPRRFAPFAADLVWAEGLVYVPDRAYERLTGREWDRGTRHRYESYSNTAGWERP
ncbi:MAG TPA: DUF4240 domain-containing protein [Phytomonospora sp.]